MLASGMGKLLAIAAHPVRYAPSPVRAAHAFVQHVGIDVADGDLGLAARDARGVRRCGTRCRPCRPPHPARASRAAGSAIRPSRLSTADGRRPTSDRSSDRSARRPRKRPRGRASPSRFPAHRGSRRKRWIWEPCSWTRTIARARALGYGLRFATLNGCYPCPNCPKSKPSAWAFSPRWKDSAFTKRGDAPRRSCACPSRSASPKRLTGRRVTRLSRRAKYLLAELDSGETLVIHLGMSGRMSVYAQGQIAQARTICLQSRAARCRPRQARSCGDGDQTRPPASSSPIIAASG